MYVLHRNDAGLLIFFLFVFNDDLVINSICLRNALRFLALLRCQGQRYVK